MNTQKVKSRKQNVLTNFTLGTGLRILSYALSFVVRMVFLSFLTVEYLGVNNLFSNVIMLLSIAESGTGTVFQTLLYEPLFHKDEDKTKALLKYMHKAFSIISMIIVVVSILLIPILEWIIGESNVEHIYFIYFLFVFKMVVIYLLMHYDSLLSADQKKYVTTIYVQFWSFLQYIIQLLVLITGGSFDIYMMVQIVCAIAPYVSLRFKCRREYPFLKSKGQCELNKGEKKQIKVKILAGFSSHVSYVVFNGTDSMVITKLLGLGIAGIYSNYLMILSVFNVFMSTIQISLSASIGNLLAEKKGRYSYAVYKKLLYIYMIVAFFVTGGIIIFINPLISICFGKEFLLEQSTVVIFASTFVLGNYGVKSLFDMFKWGSGYFVKDTPLYLIEAFVNLGFSIIFGYSWGISGILLASAASSLITFFSSIYILGKYVFSVSFFTLFREVVVYIIILSFVIYIVYCAMSNFVIYNIEIFCIGILLGGGLLGILMIVCNMWRPEFRYFINLIVKKVMK